MKAIIYIKYDRLFRLFIFQIYWIFIILKDMEFLAQALQKKISNEEKED